MSVILFEVDIVERKTHHLAGFSRTISATAPFGSTDGREDGCMRWTLTRLEGWKKQLVGHKLTKTQRAASEQASSQRRREPHCTPKRRNISCTTRSFAAIYDFPNSTPLSGTRGSNHCLPRHLMRFLITHMLGRAGDGNLQGSSLFYPYNNAKIKSTQKHRQFALHSSDVRIRVEVQNSWIRSAVIL